MAVVPPAVVNGMKVVPQSLVASKHLAYRKGATAGRTLAEHKAFFVFRRALWLLAEGPPEWLNDSTYAAVIARLNSEYTAVDSFATAALGSTGHPGALTGGTDPTTPAHLDLADVARRRITDPATTVAAALKSRDSTVKQRTASYVAQRRKRGLTIIWRAAAIHPELWQASSDQSIATLRTAAMNEILDRRLHAVERMACQISRADALGATRLDVSQGRHGPWKDGLRVRMFEYPRLDASFATALAPIAPESPDPPQHGEEWQWESATHRRIIYGVPPGHRFRHAAAPAFPLTPTDPRNYIHDLWLGSAPDLTPATALDALYTPAEDYWDRSWIYCDHVVSSLHLMALLFGKRRRTGSDDAFNNLVTSHPRGYVEIGPLLAYTEGASGNQLMASTEPDPAAQPPQAPLDPAFQNILVAPEDIQIGDHLIFWNSVLYPLVSNGEWQLENAVVVEVRSDPERHGIKIGSLHMQGHGTVALTIGDYERMLGRHLARGMTDARATAAGASSTTSVLNFNGGKQRLVRWSPFGDTWTAPGAWWVRVPLGTETAETVLKRLRKGVAPDPSYPQAAPFTDSVYFPLWEPQYPGGWSAYLAKRAQGQVRVSPRLRVVPADRALIPGLHYTGGQWDPLPIVRPRVAP